MFHLVFPTFNIYFILLLLFGVTVSFSFFYIIVVIIIRLSAGSFVYSVTVESVNCGPRTNVMKFIVLVLFWCEY